MKRVLLTFLILFFTPYAQAKELNILTTIKPLQSIVQNIVGDIAEVNLLLGKNDSPHSFTLKPSDARKLYSADIVFYINPKMESFIEKLVKDKSSYNYFVDLSISVPDLIILPGRHGHFWSDGFSFHNVLDHEETDHDHNHDHSTDYHIWLDIDNVLILSQYIKTKLITLAPEYQEDFKNNYDIFVERLKILNSTLKEKLEPYKDFKFIVYHDAYQYFDKKYELSANGSITINPYVKPSVKKLKDLTEAIKRKEISCIFSEPQFPPKLVEIIKDSTNISTGTLDAEWGLKNNDTPTKDAYFEMMNNLADDMIDCFKDSLK